MLPHAAIACLLLLPAAEKPAPADNSLCYVCHQDLTKETIAQVHASKGIGCVSCHGPSKFHMHDEMLMTKPDVLFGRSEVEDYCQACHEEHKHPASVKKFRIKWYGKDRPNGRIINKDSICTDCHGKHNIVKESRAPKEAAESVKWSPLFDGKSLAPWKSPEKTWSVRRGRIACGLPAKKRTSLARRVSLETFRLYLTFRLEGRQQTRFFWKGRQTRAVTLASDVYGAGSLLVGDKLAVRNLHQDALDPEGWNTLSLASGEFLQVWLNGKELYRVRNTPSRITEVGLAATGKEDGARLEIGEIQVERQAGKASKGATKPPSRKP